MRVLLLISLASFILAGCQKKPQGFGLEGAMIRYETKTFDDPEVLAEANGQRFTKSQILDKSVVLKDLSLQENEALIGLAYLEVLERFAGAKPTGVVTIHLPESKTPLAQILSRFDHAPEAGLTIAFKPSDDPNHVATYKDLRISRDELNINHVVFTAIEQRRFQEIASQLNSQMSRILLNEKAVQAGKDLATMVKEAVGGEKPVSDEELFEYLKSIGFAKEELTDELKVRFQEALKQRNQQNRIEEYVAKNILKGPVSVSFTEPVARIQLNDNWRPIMGYSDAPVSVVVFSAVTCPDCHSFIVSLREIMQEYDGHLKLNWIHNFEAKDGISYLMAETALCLDSIGKGHSINFAEEFSKREAPLDENTFVAWADSQGLDKSVLKSCIEKQNNKELVAQHLAYSKKVGIVANPTIWIEGRTLQGNVSKDQIEGLVRNAVNLKNSSKWSAFWRRIKSKLFN